MKKSKLLLSLLVLSALLMVFAVSAPVRGAEPTIHHGGALCYAGDVQPCGEGAYWSHTYQMCLKWYSCEWVEYVGAWVLQGSCYAPFQVPCGSFTVVLTSRGR